MPRKSVPILLIMLVSIICWRASGSSYTHGSLSPAHWPTGELEKYTQLDLDGTRPKPLVTSSRAIVAGLLGARAVHSATQALKEGGNALDAALLGALTKITLSAGEFVSFAGILGVAYYDARTKQTYYLNAGYDRPSQELDPLTIPKGENPSGRSVLVPGFMAGAEVAHQRFGKLPFSALFEPAIFFADNGFPTDAVLACQFRIPQVFNKAS